MRKSAYLVALALALAPTAASAEIFKLYGELGGGGNYGKGLSGAAKDDAFFKRANGPAIDVVLGARFLILDTNVSHLQFYGDGTKTWTQFSAGLGIGIDLGSEQDKKAFKSGYFDVGAGIAFGVGTGAQVDPPLDASEVTDKAFMLQGHVGFGKHLSKIFDLGVVVPVSWGYFFKSGAANDTNNQYQGIQAQGLLVLRANLRFI